MFTFARRLTPRRDFAKYFASSVVLLLLVALFSCTAFTCVAQATENRARRTIVIGDLHGDYEHTLVLLQLAGITDANANWTGGDSTDLIQMGDVLDRGPDDKPLLDLLMSLQEQAAAHGSSVTVLLGNHELMNIQQQLHYVHPDSYEAFGGKHNRQRAFSEGGAYGDFIRRLPVVHVAHRSLFVHAGLHTHDAKLGVAEINKLAREALATDWFKAPIFSSLKGPLWTRLVINDATAGNCDEVSEVLQLLGLDRMVVGHTPQRDGAIGSFCDGKLLAVDVGVSRWMYSNLAALEIVSDTEGNVELSEILPSKTTEELNREYKLQQDEEGTGRREERGEEADSEDELVLDEKLKSDPTLLQEILDALREKSAPDDVYDDERVEV